MSYEIVKRIGISKGKIKVNSACNNCTPKLYSTWEYGDFTKENLTSLFRDIMGNELSIMTMAQNKFTCHYSNALLEVAKKYYGSDVRLCLSRMKNIVWYMDEFDPIEKKPTEIEYMAFNEMVDIFYKNINKRMAPTYCMVFDRNGYALKTLPNRNGIYSFITSIKKSTTIYEENLKHDLIKALYSTHYCFDIRLLNVNDGEMRRSYEQ